MVNSSEGILALIGTGWAAANFAITNLESKYIKYVIGSSIEKAQTFANKYKIPYPIDNYNILNSDDSIKGIIICVQISEVFNIINEIEIKDISVLIEKPGAMDSLTLSKIRDLTLRRNQRVSIAYQLRFDDNFKRAKEIIDSNEIGNINVAYMRMFYPGFNQETDAYRKWCLEQNSPSIWIEGGVHLVDLDLWYFGDAINKSCLNTDYRSHNISGTCLIKHNNNIRNTLDISMCGGMSNQRGLFEFFSNNGVVIINRGTYTNKLTKMTVEKSGKIIYESGWIKENNFTKELNYFVKCCLDYTCKMPVDINLGISILQLAEQFVS